MKEKLIFLTRKRYFLSRLFFRNPSSFFRSMYTSSRFTITYRSTFSCKWHYFLITLINRFRDRIDLDGRYSRLEPHYLRGTTSRVIIVIKNEETFIQYHMKRIATWFTPWKRVTLDCVIESQNLRKRSHLLYYRRKSSLQNL